MSSVVISGNTSGTVTLFAPDVSGTTVLTLPTSNGTVLTQNSSAPANSFVVDASGNVGIGTSSPATKLNIGSGGVLRLNRTDNGIYGDISYVAGTGFVLNDANSDGYTYQQSGSTKLRIDSSGNLLVGTTSGSARLYVQADGSLIDPITVSNTNTTANSQYAIVFVRNGVIRGSIQTTNAATSYLTSSDYRLKENVQPMIGALDKVAALKPCTYVWKDGGADGQGFIAHELAEVVPEAVAGEKDAVDAEGNPVYQGIDTSFLVATLTAAIQELKAIVDEQAEKIKALEGAK